MGIISFLLKALFVYFLFIFLKSFFRSIKLVKQTQQPSYRTSQNKRSSQGDVIEAEYRVLKK